jgi:hypothetical protein
MTTEWAIYYLKHCLTIEYSAFFNKLHHPMELKIIIKKDIHFQMISQHL